MFKLINLILSQDEFYGESKNIDVLKGINRYPDSIIEAMKLAKRKLMSNRANKKDC